MNEIHQIVVPVDFHQHTDKIVDYALYVAEKFSANISYLHVVEKLDNYAGIVHPSMEKIGKELQANAEERMSNLLEDTKDRCSSCTGKVLIGDVVDAIVDHAAHEKADLLILGTHGSKGLQKILLGSVAERVMKNAPCPTLLFKP